MRIDRFEDLIAWQKAQDLAIEVYAAFDKVRDWGFKDQIQRASVSVSNNISEGFGRKGLADYLKFLYIAYSSCNEVKSMVYLALRLKFISDIEQKKLLDLCNEEGKVINGLIASLEKLKP
jgi:four helix bundle protein